MYDLSKKYIFTHPPKCGGTSLEEILGFLQLRERHPGIHAFKHGSLEMHAGKIRSKGLDPEDFFKFSIIRNPWDRAVSFYNHNRYKAYDYHLNKSERMMPAHVRDSRQMTFKEFVFKYFKRNFNSDVVTRPYMFLNGKFAVDFIIRLERIKEDFLFVESKLQIGLESDIPHLNNSDQYIERKSYRDYYDNNTKDFVRDLFKWDIETFDYSF